MFWSCWFVCQQDYLQSNEQLYFGDDPLRSGLVLVFLFVCMSAGLFTKSGTNCLKFLPQACLGNNSLNFRDDPDYDPKPGSGIRF